MISRCFVTLIVVSCAYASLDVIPGRNPGSFTIKLDGKKLFEGEEVILGDKCASNGSLKPVGGVEKTTGEDELGTYTAQVVRWAGDGNATAMHTAFRQYTHDSNMVVFEQFFPRDLTKSEIGSSKLSALTLFPAFQKRGVELDCFSYHGVFAHMKACNVSNYQESHQGGAPLVIYDSRNSSLPMVVFSPLNQPKAHHMAANDEVFGAGVKATVELIPAGWSQLFLLSASSGVNKGMLDWGDRMLKFTGKARADPYKDVTHGKIGFWTDNGGYYHYDTGVKNETYEQVLPKVKAYHDSIGVPFGHWQFDSWFYPKDGGVNHGGGGGAVVNWTAMPSVFPSGMAGINKLLDGMPTVMHNRQWSIHSDYIKNLSFEWYKSAKAAVPKDPQAFFDWFFKQQEGWGLSMYEQDWMCTEYDEVDALQTNISLADLWLKGMAEGVTSSNRTQQYCMPYPNDVLSASAYPAVTNARASDDYVSPTQWQIGGTSLFYWAIGILPFKDGFYSSNHKQVGGQTVGPETSPDRQALIATLSCAMVGPMDGIYLMNASRVMTTCRKDGYVLKPDKPLSTSEYCFLHADPTCTIYGTYSEIPGYGRVAYHYNDKGGEALAPQMAPLDPTADQFVVYNWYTGALQAYDKGNVVIEAGYEGHAYALVSPVKYGWAFLGEVDKFVPASRFRFKSVTPTKSHLTVDVEGVRGETLKICAAHSLKLVCSHLSFSSTGSETLLLRA